MLFIYIILQNDSNRGQKIDGLDISIITCVPYIILNVYGIISTECSRISIIIGCLAEILAGIIYISRRLARAVRVHEKRTPINTVCELLIL